MKLIILFIVFSLKPLFVNSQQTTHEQKQDTVLPLLDTLLKLSSADSSKQLKSTPVNYKQPSSLVNPQPAQSTKPQVFNSGFIDFQNNLEYSPM